MLWQVKLIGAPSATQMYAWNMQCVVPLQVVPHTISLDHAQRHTAPQKGRRNECVGTVTAELLASNATLTELQHSVINACVDKRTQGLSSSASEVSF